MIALVLWASLALASPAEGEGPPAAPPPAPSPQDRFEALVREIGVLNDDLDRLSRRESGLLIRLERLSVESALKARLLDRLALEQETARSELAATRDRLAAEQEALRREEADLGAHLRETYKTGRLSELRLVLSLTEPVDVMRAMAYLEAAARRRMTSVSSLRQRRASSESLERLLDAQTRSLDTLLRESRLGAEQLRQVREQARELLASTRDEAAAHREAAAELRRAAEELEAAIVAASNDDGLPPVAPRVSFARLRGALEWPVSGEVAVGYGSLRHPRFGTVTPHPGLEIETRPGSAITAVMGGRVVYSRRLAGYGNTVLLDHGDRYLTVYSRAAVLSVVEGQEVVQGQPLGVCADESTGGGPPTVYFELRHEGRAIDPAGWLKKRNPPMREDPARRERR